MFYETVKAAYQARKVRVWWRLIERVDSGESSLVAVWRDAHQRCPT